MDAGRRLKYGAILAILLGCGLAMLAATQQWYAFELSPEAGHGQAVTVQGSAADQAVMALALAGVALAAALAIAGPLIRVILGALGVVIGGSLVLSTVMATREPVQAGAAALTKATGITGDSALAGLVVRTEASAWPLAAIAGGVIAGLAALAVLVTSRRWPASSHKYQSVRFAAAEETPPVRRSAEPASERDRAIDDWDELSRGEDPTR